MTMGYLSPPLLPGDEDQARPGVEHTSAGRQRLLSSRPMRAASSSHRPHPSEAAAAATEAPTHPRNDDDGHCNPHRWRRRCFPNAAAAGSRRRCLAISFLVAALVGFGFIVPPCRAAGSRRSRTNNNANARNIAIMNESGVKVRPCGLKVQSSLASVGCRSSRSLLASYCLPREHLSCRFQPPLRRLTSSG
jgi:hypothetical protein